MKSQYAQKIVKMLKTDEGTTHFLSRLSYIAIAAYLRQRDFVPESILDRRRITGKSF
jgi:hypothetical protein